MFTGCGDGSHPNDTYDTYDTCDAPVGEAAPAVECCTGADCYDSGFDCTVDEDCGQGLVCADGSCQPGTPADALIACEDPFALTAVSFGAGVQNRPSALASIEVDGKPSLVIARSDGLAVWANRGGPMFEETGVYDPLVGLPRALALADFNADARPDIVAVGEGQPGRIGRLYGDEMQVFVAQPVVMAGANPTRLEIGDLNDDGLEDLVLMSSGLPDLNVVHVLLADGMDRFLVPLDLPLAQPPLDMVMTDLSGDGNLDLAIADAAGVAVYEGRGGGAFEATTRVDTATQATRAGVVVADLGADGTPDIIRVGDLQGSAEVATWAYAGPATDPNPVQAFSLQLRVSLVKIADLGGDGELDLVAAAAVDQGQQVPGQLVVMPVNGDGSLRCQLTVPSPKPATDLLVADLDSDGQLDVALPSGEDVLTMFLSGGG